MNPDEANGNSTANDAERQQQALYNQLFQAATTMHHIDELFQWLAYTIARRFNIQLIQFWTNQLNQAGRLSAHLRTIVRQDTTIPEQLVINELMTSLAQRVISERRSYQPQAVETIFPSYQALLLKRYGLYYCGACFNSRNAFIAAAESMLFNQGQAVPFAMTTLLFMRHHPQPNVAYTINTLLDQATILAEQRGLLQTASSNPYNSTAAQFTPAPASAQFTPTPAPTDPFTPFPPQPETLPTLEQLIPHRKQNADLLLSDNPFASKKDVISDKKARLLFSAINGRSAIGQLCNDTGLTTKEIYLALQFLIMQQRIEIYQPNGQQVNIPPWRNDI